jgi:transcriptional regulator with XRE-family HTH domain
MTGSDDSAALARRHVRLRVRRARESLGLTQTQMAEAMEWSLSKVMRIENGDITMAPNDLKSLLTHLKITDRADVDALVQAAKRSRKRQQWWDAPKFRDFLSPAMLQLIQLENEAKSIRYFYSLLIPGRLQIPAFANAVINAYADDLTREQITARLEFRRRRHASRARADGPMMYLLLDESVLHRRLGVGARILGEQLDELVKLIDAGTLVIRVVRYETDAPIPMLGTYEIHDLADEDDDSALIYRESDLVDDIVDDPDKIARHRDIFERMWKVALDEESSRRLIENRVMVLLAQAK